MFEDHDFFPCDDDLDPTEAPIENIWGDDTYETPMFDG